MLIVWQCARCTNSTTTTNRGTNGHRFVFHSSQVKASERHYIPDEPGIHTEEAIPVQCRTSPEPSLSDSDEPPSLVSASSSLSSMDELNLPRLLNPSHSQKEVMVEKRRLRAGDVVYWHHLTRGGEIPGVCEDGRARVGRAAKMIVAGR